MTQEISICNYKENDLGEMLTIFNHFVKVSFAVYCDTEINIDQFKKLIEHARIILILRKNEKVIGFGYIGNYKPYQNFDRTGVLTYFIIPQYTGRGLGTQLFTELISKGKNIGITNYLAHISSKNEQSLRFHENHGFEEVGRFKNLAVKLGEEIDIVWVQKQFGDQ